MAYTRTDDREDWINEGRSPTERQRRAQVAVNLRDRVSVEIPPYVVSAPEWAARWGETAPPVGTVLRWTQIESGETRVALHVSDGEWSASPSRDPLSFPELARLIANSPCSVAVDWREIPTVEARPAGDDAVKDWASQFLAEREVAKINGDLPTEGH